MLANNPSFLLPLFPHYFFFIFLPFFQILQVRNPAKITSETSNPMAFHVACPITCKRICFCTLGFSGRLKSETRRTEFLGEVLQVERFLRDQWPIRVLQEGTVQVAVPRIAPAVTVVDGGDGLAGDGDEMLSAQTKRAALQRRAVAASLAAEDYARKFETGNLAEVSGEAAQDIVREEQGVSAAKVMCRICFSGENEGSNRAKKMLSCKLCSKKYHRNCLKSWAEYRDLFHWNSWACPSCRTCEVCRRAGDPNKFMFCKRCDGAYHCYCQQPPHKNRTPGPFLCPKHTRCHSCGSNVPGSGLSTRWFLGYTCCDACGRLFVKGKYCPVCLKVYRDSESTPMVCCDACQRWVHCECDGISDEKYQQFQADGNLYYKCAACRGDCYQVRDLDDAVQEIWRRRDKADRDQIASLRAAAGLPSQENVFSVSPYSDDEENEPIILKSDQGHSLKISVKGFAEKSTKNTKEYGKKLTKSYSQKKNTKKKDYHVSQICRTEEPYQSLEKYLETQSLDNSLAYESDDVKSHRSEGFDLVSPPTNKTEKSYISQSGSIKNKSVDEIGINNEERADKLAQIKTTGKHASKPDNVRGTKLVIHLGARNKNVSNSPRSEASYQKEQETPTSNGSEDNFQNKVNDKKQILGSHDGTSKLDRVKGVKADDENVLKNAKHKGRESSLIKLGKAKSEVSDSTPSSGRSNAKDELQSIHNERTSVVLGRAAEQMTESTLRNDEVTPRKHPKAASVTIRSENHENSSSISASNPSIKDPKPLLRLKFKNPYLDSRSSWAPLGNEDKSSIKGQRSKRKRPSPLMEKASLREDETEGQMHRDRPIDEDMDANWILKKLGKDAIGKRVEVHQSSDNSWHKGVISNVIEGTAALSVSLDDGRARTLELGKQGIRFISQRPRRSKTVHL
ncbi:hypothetical protein H6P81_000981 [Aristolochia fimbriata]|uniref:Uncharacterized protein n=1 Tax=Aristolochia fimbriata TaxID=158543 RepID=A0AAV7F5W9_ARIFI|nr:hypothetical protein H6P81_000981 [Aristolochia fimbriata]